MSQHNHAFLREASDSSLRPGFEPKHFVSLPTTRSQTDIYIIEPPRGLASTADGLDLTQMRPPVQEFVADIRHFRAGVPYYVILKTVDHITHDSLRDAMAGARLATSIQRLPNMTNRVEFHIYVLEQNFREKFVLANLKMPLYMPLYPIPNFRASSFRQPLFCYRAKYTPIRQRKKEVFSSNLHVVF